MQKLYQKHELWFVLGWIAFYVVAVSFADELSRTIGIEKIVTLPLLLAMCAVLLLWMKRNDLFQVFGLCKGSVPPSRLLWYLPLAALISSNLWFGLRWNLPLHETLLYIGSMINPADNLHMVPVAIVNQDVGDVRSGPFLAARHAEQHQRQLRGLPRPRHRPDAPTRPRGAARGRRHDPGGRIVVEREDRDGGLADGKGRGGDHGRQ